MLIQRDGVMATPLPLYAPVGGYPSSFDIHPTIAYLALYSLLLPFCFVRITASKSRNVVQLPITAAIIERILNLVVRLLQATGRWSPTNALLLEYQQVTLGWGWIALSHAMLAFWRSLAVNATRVDPQSSLHISKGSRLRLKWTTYVLDILFWVAQILGVVAGIDWRQAFNGDWAITRRAQGLRYAGTILAMLLSICAISGLVWCQRRLSHVDKRACAYLISFYVTLLIVPLYRLSIFKHLSIESTPTYKALFYTFHIGPEYLIAATLIIINTRLVFGTGAWGDPYFSWTKGWRSSQRHQDPPPLIVDADIERAWVNEEEEEEAPALDGEDNDMDELIPKMGRPVSFVLPTPPKSHFTTRTRARSPPVDTPTSSPPLPRRFSAFWKRLDDDPFAADVPPPSAARIQDHHTSGCFSRLDD